MDQLRSMDRRRWRRPVRWAGTFILAFSSLVEAAAAQEAPPPPQWDLIAFETKSWGEPLSTWRMNNTGGGSWTETVKADGQGLGSYSLVWHEIEPKVQNYIAIERLLKGLPKPAPDFKDCANFMTDMPYGTIRLTRGATTTEIAWNSGCLDEAYKPLLDTLRAADGQVREWGKAGTVLRRETGH